MVVYHLTISLHKVYKCPPETPALFGSVSLHLSMPVTNQLRATVMFAIKFLNVRFGAKISHWFYYNVPNVPNVR